MHHGTQPLPTRIKVMADLDPLQSPAYTPASSISGHSQGSWVSPLPDCPEQLREILSTLQGNSLPLILSVGHSPGSPWSILCVPAFLARVAARLCPSVWNSVFVSSVALKTAREP